MTHRAAFTILLALAVTACGSADAEVAEAERAEPAPVLAVAEVDADLPPLLVYKTPTCGCCNGWVDHLREAGFAVETRDTRDLMSVKLEAGVPTAMTSCHTALVDGYVVEGHIPAEHIKRLLAERPELAGIAVPGMPIGSPGMEGRNPQPYEILSWDAQGNAAVYAEVDPR